MIQAFAVGVLAFDALTFFSTMLAAVIFGALFLGAVYCVAEDRSKAKRGEYLMTAGICAVLYWLLHMIDIFLLGPLWVLIGVPWVCCKWLDISIARSLLALLIVMGGHFLLNYMVL